MRSFRFLDHTADVLVQCCGDTFENLLIAAAEAMYDVALESVQDSKVNKMEINLSAESKEDLMLRFLQELLFLLDVEHFVCTDFDFHGAGEGELSASVRGYLCEGAERATEIKAATYHGLKIEKTESGLVAEVLFDL